MQIYRFWSILRFILTSLVDLQELHCCCIRLQVFITLYRSNSRLWNSHNLMQLQVMRALALNFSFVLVFDKSKIGVQFRNKLTLRKANIALQTILLATFMYSTCPQLILLCTLCFCFLDERMYLQYMMMANDWDKSLPETYCLHHMLRL